MVLQPLRRLTMTTPFHHEKFEILCLVLFVILYDELESAHNTSVSAHLKTEVAFDRMRQWPQQVKTLDS